MATLGDLPREVLRTISLFIYDPLDLTQQDRLTWGIFSTVDMHEERQEDLFSLISFGHTCRRVRKEVRVILFRCIRIPTIAHAHEICKAESDWTPFVRSLIIDLTMFDLDEVPKNERLPRSSWKESALLSRTISALPCLQHLSFFADASDDSTLALLFATLIPHPHPILSRRHSFDPELEDVPTYSQPFATRLRSFGWRQRAAPPSGFRTFSQTSTFVSTHHVLRNAPNLNFVVLDADMDEMAASDVIAAVGELSHRDQPGLNPVSIMLCGPIAGWDGFLPELVNTFKDVKELFFDRPLKKSIRANTNENEFFQLLQPLGELTRLQLLQVGSYTFSLDIQKDIALRLARLVPTLLIVGLLGEEGDTTWWGIWRGPSPEVDIIIRPMGDGHLHVLEECARASRRPSLASGADMVRAKTRSRESLLSLGDGYLTPERGMRSRRTSFDDEARLRRVLSGQDDGLKGMSAIEPGRVPASPWRPTGTAWRPSFL